MLRCSRGLLGCRQWTWAIDSPLLAAVVATVCGALLLPFSRLDYDRLHDGWMVESAVAVHDGQRVHSDVFNHFGPVNPWIQDLFMHLPFPPALALRLFAVLCISLTVFFMADVGRRRPSGSPISQQSGLLAAVTWVVLSDVWGAGPMRPWPVFTLNLLVVLAAYLSLRAWYEVQRFRLRGARALLFGSGFAVGIALFVRVASGLLLIVALGLCVCGLSLARLRHRRMISWAAAGLAAAVSLVLLRLSLAGSLGDFYQNTIVFPVEYFGPNPLAPILFLRIALPVYGPPVVVGLLCLLYLRYHSALASGQRAVVGMAGGLVMLALTFLLARSPLASLEFRDYFSGGRALLLFLTCTMVVVVGTYGWVVQRSISRRSMDPTTFAWFALAVFSTAMLGEIPPDYTVRHLWWSLPLGLILLFAAVPCISGSDRLRDNPLMIPLSVIAAYTVYIGTMTLSLARVQAPADTVASGMLVQPSLEREISEDSRLLQEALGTDKAVFATDQGDLAVLRGAYSSADPYFTCHTASDDFTHRLEKASVVVVEPEAVSCPSNIEGQLAGMGFAEVARNERLVVYARK